MLRGDSTHLFSVKRSENFSICPVQNFMLYLSICRLIGIDISSGYVFRTTTKAGHVSDKPFTGSSVYNRFKWYLKDVGLDDRETPHSFRAGYSIILELLGVPKSEVPKHLHWRTVGMVDHYNDLTKITQSGPSVEALSSSSSSVPDVPTAISSYKALNTLRNFTPVFP